MIKRPTDVKGVQISCPNFSQCPICYGCRAISNCSVCDICREDSKLNICNLDLHRPDLIEKFITRTKLEIRENGVGFEDNK